MALGGTAVGTGLNTHPEFAKRVASVIALKTGMPFVSAPNKFAQLAAHDAIVAASGALNTLAVSLMKIASDVRWVGSGPRCGLQELALPANEPGSSIMPGKVNPSLAECMNMICFNIIGNDTAVAHAAQGGQFELNVMMPGMLKCVLESTDMLKNFLPIFSANLIDGLTANKEKLRADIENSPVIVTLLAPKIGYLKSCLLYTSPSPRDS